MSSQTTTRPKARRRSFVTVSAALAKNAVEYAVYVLLAALAWYVAYWVGRAVIWVADWLLGAGHPVGAVLLFLITGGGLAISLSRETPMTGHTLPLLVNSTAWLMVVPLHAPLLFSEGTQSGLLTACVFLFAIQILLETFGHPSLVSERLSTAIVQGPVGNDSGNVGRAPPTNSAVVSGITFADLAGMDEPKARLLAAAKAILGSRGGAEPRNGMLLHGEPGNGKTKLVEALAGELDVPILTATFGNVASVWVNQTTQNVVQVFRDAKAQAPCVLFIDEIDALLVKRDGVLNADSEAARTVNALLTEIVNLRDAPIVFVAATNFLDRLDQASIREGRFDFKIEIPAPDQPAREGIIRATLARSDAASAVTAEVIKTVAARWRGYSAARISAVVEELCLSQPGAVTIELSDFMDALRRVQGRRGSLPEGTKPLDQMHFPAPVAKRLKGIAARMRHIEEVEALGGTVPAGLLFWGPPGTGKTATARALAKSTGWGFLAVSGNELLGDPKRIDVLLKEAAEIRPCIVFIDEADDVLAERGTNPYATTVTNKLLTAIDGADGKVPDVVFIAATNLPETMDAAALRGGRFTEKIEFTLPDVWTLAAFVTDWMSGTKAKLGADFTAEAVAHAMGTQPIANAQEILQQAANLHVERRMSAGQDSGVTLVDVRMAIAAVSGCG